MTVISHISREKQAREALSQFKSGVVDFLARKAESIAAGKDFTNGVLTFVEQTLPHCATALLSQNPDEREEAAEILEHVGAELAAAVRAREFLNDPDTVRKATTLASLANAQAHLYFDAAIAAQASGSRSDAQYAINAHSEYEDRLAAASAVLSLLVETPPVRKIAQEMLDHRDLVLHGELGLRDLLARLSADRPVRDPL